MKALILVFFFSFGISQATDINCPTEPDKVVICYFASWSVYRPDLGYFNSSYIDPNLCTHLIYTFAGLNLDSKIASLDYVNDIDRGSYKAFTKLKEGNPCLKTLLAIGGWNEGSKKYSVMAYDQKSREAFADSVLRFLIAYDFDGLDLDWEYPTQRGGIDADRDTFVELVKVLNGKLKIWNLLLTMAIPLSTDIIQKAYNLQELAPYVDYIQLMAYDFTPGNSEATGLSAPIDKIQESVDYILSNGVSSSKLVLGIATYARSFTLEDPTENGIGAKAVGPGPAGEYTKELGFLSFYELLAKVEEGKHEIIYTTYKTYYAFKDVEWLTFDLEDSYIVKVQYALEKNLRGVMVWTIDTDDFHGVQGVIFPVLTIINRTLKRN